MSLVHPTSLAVKAGILKGRVKGLLGLVVVRLELAGAVSDQSVFFLFFELLEVGYEAVLDWLQEVNHFVIDHDGISSSDSCLSRG